MNRGPNLNNLLVLYRNYAELELHLNQDLFAFPSVNENFIIKKRTITSMLVTITFRHFPSSLPIMLRLQVSRNIPFSQNARTVS